MISRTLSEAREAPDAVERLLVADRDVYESLGADLRERPPQALLTLARGSSDHAAHYMAYLIRTRLGRLVTSLPMSLITLYKSRIQCDMRQHGARVLLAAAAGTAGSELPLVATAVEDLDPITAIQSFYPMVEELARARALDPDAPRHLAKVTVTR